MINIWWNTGRGWRWRHQYWCHFVDAFLRRGRHGQCECQHFQLPGFPEVQFTCLGTAEKRGFWERCGWAAGHHIFFWNGVLVFAVFWSLFWCWRSHFRSWKYISSWFFLPLPDPLEQKVQGMRTIIIAKLNHRMDPLSSSFFKFFLFDRAFWWWIGFYYCSWSVLVLVFIPSMLWESLLHPGSQVHVVPLGF